MEFRFVEEPESQAAPQPKTNGLQFEYVQGAPELNVEPEPSGFFSVEDTVSALGEAFSGLTKTVPASYYAAKEGLARPDQYSKESIAAFDTQREYFKKLEQEAATRQAQGRMTSVGEAIRGAGQSLGFTVAGMAPAIAGGAVAGSVAGALFPPAEAATIPIGAIAGGIGSMVASAPVSYRMAGGQFLYDAFKSLEENKGRPLTEEEKTKAYNELLPIAQNTALWEAGPEAIGNAVELGALKYAFGFGKKAATNVAGQAIKKANDTLLKKVGAVAGGQAIELAGETITQTQQGPDQAKMEQYVQTGSTAGAPNEYQGLAGAVKAFKEVAPTTLALGAITTGAGGVVKVAGMGGKEVGKVLFTQPKTPEQIAENQINDAANRVANDLSISPDDTEANNLNQQIKALSQVQEIRKQTLAAIEPTSREAQTLKLDIAEGESMLGELNKQFTGLTGLSETITEAEKQQAELAKAITTPEAKARPLPTDVLPTETPGATYGREEQVYDVFGGITRKPVAIPKPAELPAAPTIEEQTAEGTYGGQTGVFDVFAGARRKSVEVAPAPAIEEEPMSVSDEKEFAELNDLMERKGQAENKVRGVKFTKQDQSRYQNLVTKFRDRLIETTDPKNDPVVGTDINGTPIQRSNKGTFYTFENGRVRTGPAFSEATPAPVTEQAAPAEAPAPEVGDIVAVDRKNNTEFALVKGLLPERPDMFSIGIRLIGSNQPFESGGYGHNTNKDSVMKRFFEKERRNLQDIEIKNQYFQNILNEEEGRVSAVEAKESEKKQQEQEKQRQFNEEKVAYEDAISQVKIPTGKSETMRFTAPDGSDQAFESKRYGDVGIRKVTSGKNALYNVDHWHSGLRIMQFNSLSEAKKFTQAIIASGADISKKDIQESELEKLRPIVRYFRSGEIVPSLTSQPTPAVSETITKPKLGEKGGVLIPTKEDFIQAGQNIYEAGMEFGAWAKQMIQQFGDAVREFLGEVWQAVSGAPAKLNELMGYLPKKGEAGAVNVGGGKLGGKTQAVAEPAPTGKPEQIMSQEVGPPKTTPEGIIAKTKELLRKQFDPSKVSVNNTTEAFRALGRLTGRGGTDFAKELNDVGRVVDESGAASEISMGAALFINDLFEYSIRLAAEGNKKLLGMMLTNINKLPTAAIGVSDAARDLRARLELSQRFRMMGDAEQDAYTNYVAEFIYGPNPTKDQIQSIKDAYAAVEKTPQVTEQELTDEIKAVGDRTGTDLVGKINEEFTKATEKGKEKRKTEEQELDKEYEKVQKQADAEIEKLAKIQSDTPSFDPAAARQTANDVRAIVANDLKQRPDMGRKTPWKSMLVAKLQEAGVELAAAETLADIVWRQHEINNLSRELSSINKAIEKGPISEIVKAIKETPLEQQQNPNWRYEVMRDYLRRAGLSLAQAERIAKLMDISLQKRFTMAQEQAFTDAISKTAPWKSGDTRSRRAFQKVLQALRAGALDPARNVLSDMAALNGWTGFTPEQYKTLLKNDAILADPKAGELKKAEAYKAIQDVISKAKLPIRARDVIGQYYDAQALSGIPTLTVNAFSPIAFAMRNLIVEIGSGTLKGNPKAITNATTAFMDSMKSWANTVAYSFKNNVTVYSNVDYIVNDERLLRLYNRGVNQFKNGTTSRQRADGVKNMMIGMMDYVRRILNALDYGAIASLQNQNISKYSMAVMKRQGMSTKDANEMFGVMMKAKNDFYLQQIAIGTDKNRASILADEFYISSWSEALTKAGVENNDIKQAMDAAINDALSSVGRNRQSIDALKDESTKMKDAGVSSMPALWLLESMANAANQSESQVLKLFSRVIYGFAIVPARVIRDTAWFSPYGFVRFGYDYAAKKMGKTSPYAQSLGNDLQYSQRLNEAIAGTVALTALFALRAGSTDDPEDEDAFKIVFTGNGPQRKDDPQFYDSWYKAGNKPNTMSVYFGKTKFALNMMRGFEAFTWPAMMLGAMDDLEIRKKQNKKTNTATQLEDAAIVAGFVFDAALRRGPYAFTTKSLFGTYGDIGVEGVAKGLTFPAKTLIPILGTSLASNLSNFINDPIDRRTLDGAVWSNIPFIGPVVAPKSLNAFGEPSLSTDMASKMFKLGVPIVYDIPTDRESIKLHELVLNQGGGPSIPTRNQLAQRLDRQPTNKEYEMFVREYGTILTTSMKNNYEKLSAMKPDAYTKIVERIGNRARDIAENKVRVAAKKP